MRMPRRASSGGEEGPAATTTRSAGIGPAVVSTTRPPEPACDAADLSPLPDLDSACREVRCEPGRQRLGPDVAVDAGVNAARERRSVQRRLELGRRAGAELRGLAAEADRLQLPEDRLVGLEALGSSRDEQQPRPVHLELDAGLRVVVEELERALVQRQERLHAAFPARPRAALPEAPQPADERGIEARMDHERASAVRERAQDPRR